MPASSTGNHHATDFRRRGGRPRGREYNGPVKDLERDLRRVVRGSVRFDPASLLLYSTDASMYQVEPIGVVTPRDADDVIAAFDVARRQNVALLPRGGGTSLTGQTVNRALVLGRDAVRADGRRVRFGTVTPAEFEAKMRLDGSEGRIYREVTAIRAEYADEIRARYPKHWRRVAGYNLNELVVVAGSASPDQDVGGLSEKRVAPLNGAPLNGA